MLKIIKKVVGAVTPTTRVINQTNNNEKYKPVRSSVVNENSIYIRPSNDGEVRFMSEK